MEKAKLNENREISRQAMNAAKNYIHLCGRGNPLYGGYVEVTGGGR